MKKIVSFPFRLIPSNTKINFISKKHYAYVFSLLLTVFIIVAVMVKGLNLGIDFAGGMVIEMLLLNDNSNLDKDKDINENDSLDKDSATEYIRGILHKNNYVNFHIQEFYKGNKHNIMLRFLPTQDENVASKDVENNKLDEGVRNSRVIGNDNNIVNNIGNGNGNNNGNGNGNENDGDNNTIKVQKIKNILSSAFNNQIEFTRVEYVGPKVGADFVLNSFIALCASLVVMMLYTWIRFNWQFGIGVLIALFHDAIVTLGFYLITDYEFDLTSIAALLTIIGYSINDSVVIYDRIRENMSKYHSKSMNDIVNISINETLSRSIMTLLTTFLVCIILAIFGGDSLQGFGAAASFGIAFGAYSSIYISAPILTNFSKLKYKKI